MGKPFGRRIARSQAASSGPGRRWTIAVDRDVSPDPGTYDVLAIRIVVRNTMSSAGVRRRCKKRGDCSASSSKAVSGSASAGQWASPIRRRPLSPSPSRLQPTAGFTPRRDRCRHRGRRPDPFQQRQKNLAAQRDQITVVRVDGARGSPGRAAPRRECAAALGTLAKEKEQFARLQLRKPKQQG